MLNLTKYDSVFVLTDEQVARCCLPVAFDALGLQSSAISSQLVLPAGEEHKNLQNVQRIWDFLFVHNATRGSLLINVGGGVICDMGGFAAATYKRGIDYVNIPTTLLAMVDAACGGKTGIDYTPTYNTANGLTGEAGLPPLKNAIGVFAEPADTIIEPKLLRTLSPEQLLSGYAEMLKHALLQTPQAFAELIEFDMRDAASEVFGKYIRQSIAFKQSVVAQDPHDNGLRQQLNFGHTIGHAIEALLLDNNQKSSNHQIIKSQKPHGFCVMYGLVAEAYLSHALCGLPAEVVSTLSRFMLENYGAAPITCKDYDQLLQLMQHDKKNHEKGTITCTLLSTIGQPTIGQTITPEQIREAIEYLCSL